MANHCNLHFNKKVHLPAVGKAINYFCQHRLGLADLVESNDEEFSVLVPFDNSEGHRSNYWCSSNRQLEHRHIAFGHYDFGVKVLEFVGWKMHATHGTDDATYEKMGLYNFLSKPLIMSSYELGQQELRPTGSVEGLSLLKHEYSNEQEWVHPLNKMCAFSYRKDMLAEKELFAQRLKEIKPILDPNAKDPFYGSPLRAALSRANYPLALWLMERGIKPDDTLDYSSLPHPEYISNQYLKDISMPTLCLVMTCIDEARPGLYNLLDNLLKNGADPLLKDSRGLDMIDNFLLTLVIDKDQGKEVMKALKQYLSKDLLTQRIMASDIRHTRKLVYLNALKDFSHVR